MDYVNSPDFILLGVQMLPYQTLIKIDPGSKKAQYRQLIDQFLDCIKNGIIPSGTKLPSTRLLAGLLNIHRKTVIAAYQELIGQGWVLTRPRSGYYISSEIVIPKTLQTKAPADLFQEKLPGVITLGVSVSNPVKQVGPDVPYSHIDDGVPDARIAPFNSLIQEYKLIAQRDYKLKYVNAGSMAESVRLKQAIAIHLSKSRGFLPGTGNILTTSGAQMGIYLAGLALISPGDIIVVGSPGYHLANSTFQNQGATILEVPVDANGMDTEAVEKICKQYTVKAIYVIPHHHYPTTATLSPQRRIKMITMASVYDFLILEDDYDYDYHYSSAPHLPMASYPHSGRVIYIGSLSKSFAASLRLGFVVASTDLIMAMGTLRRDIDIRGDLLMEEATAAMFENGEMERHIRRSVKIYKERRDLICHAFDNQLKPFVSYLKPAGGLAVWMEIDKRYQVEQLADYLKKIGFCLNPRAVFGKDQLNHIRLGFASIDHQEINKLVTAMYTAFVNFNTVPNEE